MKKSDFYFDLPQELIAQTPLEKRDASRLMCLNRETGEVAHRTFSDLADLLNPGDCLVMNDSRVLPARLLGARETGGAVEVLLLRDLGGGEWECLTRPGRKTRQGTRLTFGGGELEAEVVKVADGGNRIVRFDYDGIFLEVLERLGKMPLPPYIKEKLQDKERYQTVYSREPGAVAAPTAGLHFDDSILDLIRLKGADIAFVTLHVGAGTFQPVREEDIHKHHMHSEYARLTQEVVDKIHEAKARGGKIIAVGTTSVRTLESAACASLEQGKFLAPFEGYTSIFIYPGYKFKLVDALVTNFHLPESTLIMLVCALAGYTNTMSAYRYAVKNKYKFFSYGDAMYVTKNKYAETEAEIDKKFKRI